MWTQDAVARYMQAKRAQGIARKTELAYEWALQYLPEPLPETPEPLEAVLAGVELSRESIINLHRVWSGFYAWTARRARIRNPMQLLARPKRRKTYPRVLTRAEISALWRACGTQRDQAMVAVALDTGARVGEIAGLRWDQVGPGQLMLDGKTGQHVVPMSSSTQALLIGLGDTVHVWTGRRGPLTLFGVELAYRRLFSRAGIRGSKTGPHTLRHTFATEFLRRGGSVHKLQGILGHSSIATTMRYVHLLQLDLFEGHEDVSPVQLLLPAQPA